MSHYHSVLCHVTSSRPTWAQDNDQPYFVLWNKSHLYNRTCRECCVCLFSHLPCLSRNLLIIPVCTSFPSPHLSSLSHLWEDRGRSHLVPWVPRRGPAPMLTALGTGMLAWSIPLSRTSKHLGLTPTPYLSELLLSYFDYQDLHKFRLPVMSSLLLTLSWYLQKMASVVVITGDCHKLHSFLYPLGSLKIQ